jgi:hypothetical protein
LDTLLLKSRIVGVRPDSNDEVFSVDAASHVSSDHKADAPEHFPLAQ